VTVLKLLLSKHDSFALNDSELGETSLVEHVIDTGEAKPVKTCSVNNQLQLTRSAHL